MQLFRSSTLTYRWSWECALGIFIIFSSLKCRFSLRVLVLSLPPVRLSNSPVVCRNWKSFYLLFCWRTRGLSFFVTWATPTSQEHSNLKSPYIAVTFATFFNICRLRKVALTIAFTLNPKFLASGPYETFQVRYLFLLWSFLQLDHICSWLYWDHVIDVKISPLKFSDNVLLDIYHFTVYDNPTTTRTYGITFITKNLVPI